GFGLEDQVLARVRGMERSTGRRNQPAPEAPSAEGQPAKVDESVAAVEREVLKVALQLPAVAGPEFDALEPEAFLVDAHRQVRVAIAEVGGTSAGVSGPAWTDSIAARLTDDRVRRGVHALAVEPLRSGADASERYAGAVLA